MLSDECVYNADETHFYRYSRHTHDSRTIQKRGDNYVMFNDVESVNDGMTMMIMIGIFPGTKQCPPMMMIKKNARIYSERVRRYARCYL